MKRGLRCGNLDLLLAFVIPNNPFLRQGLLPEELIDLICVFLETNPQSALYESRFAIKCIFFGSNWLHQKKVLDAVCKVAKSVQVSSQTHFTSTGTFLISKSG
jgi:hypothetical protein